jgi:hypothetical protein
MSYNENTKVRSNPVYYHCGIRLDVPRNITSNHNYSNEAPAKVRVKCQYGPH